MTLLPQELRLVTAIPGPKSQALADRMANAVANGVGTSHSVYAAAGGGVVVDVDEVSGTYGGNRLVCSADLLVTGLDVLQAVLSEASA